jgi:hypothetical protein
VAGNIGISVSTVALASFTNPRAMMKRKPAVAGPSRGGDSPAPNSDDIGLPASFPTRKSLRAVAVASRGCRGPSVIRTLPAVRCRFDSVQTAGTGPSLKRAWFGQRSRAGRLQQELPAPRLCRESGGVTPTAQMTRVTGCSAPKYKASGPVIVKVEGLPYNFNSDRGRCGDWPSGSGSSAQQIVAEQKALSGLHCVAPTAAGHNDRLGAVRASSGGAHLMRVQPPVSTTSAVIRLTRFNLRCDYPYCPQYWGGCHTGCSSRGGECSRQRAVKQSAKRVGLNSPSSLKPASVARCPRETFRLDAVVRPAQICCAVASWFSGFFSSSIRKTTMPELRRNRLDHYHVARVT